MPRGRKKVIGVPIEDQIADTLTEIDNLKAQIKAKKAKLKKLNAQKAEADKQALLNAVQSSGKTVDDVIAMLGDEG